MPMADPRVTAAIVASALFMQNLDASAVVTALPAMARDLQEDPVRLGVERPIDVPATGRPTAAVKEA